MIRVGIVGCGFIGRVHSYALKALVDAGLVAARVAAVVDSAPDRAAKFARAHAAPPVGSFEELVGAVDAVWVCTPTATHAALVELTADAGRAVFCEKPLGLDYADADRVAAALGRVPHQVGLVLRHAPVFRSLQRELASGRHGRPMTAVFRDDQCFPIGGMYGSTWRSDAAQAGGGTLLEHSIHDIDLLRWLLGEPRSVAGRTANFAGHVDVEDLGVATLEFGDGAVATLTSVWHGVASRPSTRRLEIFCEDALLWLDDDNAGPLHIETSAGHDLIDCAAPTWSSDLGVPEEFRTALALYAAPDKEFLDDLAAAAPVRGPQAADALEAHRIVDAVYASARRDGATVSLE